MHYLTVAEARERPGLRLVLSAHVPAPWGEAAKAVLAARGVSYQPVAQEVFGANDELHAWTGYRNAPIAISDDEPPVSAWLDLLMLAEQVGKGSSLLPAESSGRALVLGLSAEICAPYGFGWARRLLMLGDLLLSRIRRRTLRRRFCRHAGDTAMRPQPPRPRSRASPTSCGCWGPARTTGGDGIAIPGRGSVAGGSPLLGVPFQHGRAVASTGRAHAGGDPPGLRRAHSRNRGRARSCSAQAPRFHLAPSHGPAAGLLTR